MDDLFSRTVEPDDKDLKERLEERLGVEIDPKVAALEVGGGAAALYLAVGAIPYVGVPAQRIFGKFLLGAGAALGGEVYRRTHKKRATKLDEER
ncbi:hypothetical protein J4439_03350 [Candidatus Woesearchaeota archaeon]|nr:hypothetical protein [Candidatus Woesearchaeota archaeon]